MAESREELKRLLMKVKEESEKASLKLNIQKTKIMAFSPTTSWQIEGETMETVTGFIFLGSRAYSSFNSIFVPLYCYLPTSLATRTQHFILLP